MLTDIACKAAVCPPGKQRARLSDAGGLYLETSPSGSRRWFWKYRFGNKEKRLALGTYPAVSLKQARSERDAARRTLQSGSDPSKRRQIERLEAQLIEANTFEEVARELHVTKASGWSKQYGERWLERMEKDLFPWIGPVPLPEITAPMLLNTLRKIEKRGARETAHTLRQTAGQVFRYGVATGRCERNPAPDLHGALQPLNIKHMAAILEPAQAGQLMRAIHDYSGQPVTRTALLLSALLFQRPGNMRAMQWSEVNLVERVWTIPADKMKRTVYGKLNGRPHLVPLSPQAVELLRDLHPLTGQSPYVFPSLVSAQRPMSENTLRVAMRRMGYSNEDMTPHGFRAMARTLMVEKLNMHPDVIEAQLAHGKSGPLGAAYDRAEFMEQRRKMMHEWATYLERLRTGANPPAKRKPLAKPA
ncbi:MAG: integrase arm-type DNA-binding domain-containing protein [Hydrogenophaga sp.]|nr:integrase arm-type DNA-binding domain-containing protein [Hydrogenophaga sp.]